MKNIRRAVCLVALLALGGGLVSGLLSSCQDQYPAIFQPVDVSLSGQTARMDFDITKTQEFDYMFALAFVINTDEPDPGGQYGVDKTARKKKETVRRVRHTRDRRGGERSDYPRQAACYQGRDGAV